MAISRIAMSAYESAMQLTDKISKDRMPGSGSQRSAASEFSDMISDSLSEVNDMQTEKTTMIEAFASGEETNVHELMITLQKAGLAMSMTSAVRGKVMEAYKEILRMPF